MMTLVIMKNDLKARLEREGGGGVRVIQPSHLQLLKIWGRLQILLHQRSLTPYLIFGFFLYNSMIRGGVKEENS